ncbi:2-nitropropane dioxygenase [Mycena rebaudengoi]|nr:2-nitropropane dioxygenase [Mycena rebaudengoi]
MAVITTPITELFGIKHPVLLAGMGGAAGPELAAAVSNVGGLGVVGGYGHTQKTLRQLIRALKANFTDKSLPFGVDLLIPQVGGNARKTNYDYTKGQLPELIEVIIEEKAALFVCAIGVPPRQAVNRLHQAGIPIMNMVGHPKHVAKALAAGVDLICAQHPYSRMCGRCQNHRSPLNNKPIYVIGVGAVYDGRGLAANLMWGTQAVWVGTRFVASVESSAPKAHKAELLSANLENVDTTLIFSGRPMRVKVTPYVRDWNTNRKDEIEALTSKGILPHQHELEKHPEKAIIGARWVMGSVAAVIVHNMVEEAAALLTHGGSIVARAKL